MRTENREISKELMSLRRKTKGKCTSDDARVTNARKDAQYMTPSKQ